MQLEVQEPPCITHLQVSGGFAVLLMKIGPHYYPLFCDAGSPLTINVLV